MFILLIVGAPSLTKLWKVEGIWAGSNNVFFYLRLLYRESRWITIFIASISRQSAAQPYARIAFHWISHDIKGFATNQKTEILIECNEAGPNSNYEASPSKNCEIYNNCLDDICTVWWPYGPYQYWFISTFEINDNVYKTGSEAGGIFRYPLCILLCNITFP